MSVAWPQFGRRIVAAAVAISAFGVLNAQLLSGPRLVFGMARDGRFFAPFARLSPRFGTPVASIVLLTVIALTLMFAAGEKGVDLLLTGAVFIDGVFFALTGAAVLILSMKDTRSGKARLPLSRGYVLAAMLFVIGEMGVVIGAYLDPTVRKAALIGVAWIAGAAIVSAAWVRGPAGPARGPHAATPGRPMP